MKLAIVLALAARCLARPPRAVYFLDNNPTGANIISVPVDCEGLLLSNFTTSPTGGLGGYSTEGPNKVTPATDQLTSQGAVVVSGNRLFTVNPGSNTASLLEITPHDPTRLKLVGSPASTIGDFPVSIAFSHELQVACVLNSGQSAGIQCYDVDDCGLHLSGAFMPLDLNQTSPPNGFQNTASSIVFNPSSTALFVLVKGIDNTTPGYFTAFSVADGQVQPLAHVSRPPNFVYPWSMSFINDTHAAVSDPYFGAALVEVAYPSLEMKFLEAAPIQGSGAICWSQYSELYESLYFFDGFQSVIPVIDSRTGDFKYNMTAPEPANAQVKEQKGFYDAIVAGSHLYVLGGTAAVDVFSLGNDEDGEVPSLIQTKDLSAAGPRRNWQGIAAWPNGF